MTAQAVANTIWAAATLGWQAADASMRSALEGAALRVAPSMNAQDIANTLWAMATLGWEQSGSIKRTMWSRRAQEYEAKINSGNLIQIAEVVRDLHRAGDQPDQSYSERQLYESALDRMARELAAVENIKHAEAVEKLSKSLAKRAA
jgi:hypothetical protein